MSRTFVLSALAVGLLVSPLLDHTVTSAVPEHPRIGVVDLDSALGSAPSGKAASAKFETAVKAKQVDIDKQQAELKKEAADLQNQKAILKPDAFKLKLDALQKMDQDLRALVQKTEAELADQRQKLTADAIAHAKPIIADLAKAEGVQIIVEKSATLWVDPTLDLTAKLQAKL